MQCRMCGQTKDPEFFSVNLRRASGRNGHCKECVRIRTREWYARNQERERAKRLASSYRRRRLRGAKIRNGRGSLGGKSNAQRQAEYRARHPERLREIRKRLNALNGRRYGQAYRARHPEVSRLKSARWHARAKLTTPKWADPKAIRAIYRFASQLQKTTGEHIHVDHIVPLHSRIVCGLHCEHNLGIALRGDNISKSNRTWPGMP